MVTLVLYMMINSMPLYKLTFCVATSSNLYTNLDWRQALYQCFHFTRVYCIDEHMPNEAFY